MAQREIFRKVSLERLSSPERLDVLTAVTTSLGWLALTALGLLIFLALIWGWAGSIPVTVRGEGMLVNHGGITNVDALGPGRVSEILVRPNDVVRAGQVIARIGQPFASAGKSEALVPDSRAVTSEMLNASNIVSPVTGKVVEIKIAKGTVVTAGTPIASLEQEGNQLEAVMYISEGDGKKVQPGMKLDIIPSSVRRDEYGSMIGTVDIVSDYPASAAGIMAILGNEQLVQRLMKNGAPYAVYVTLQRDPASANGFKWSSGKGPTTRIASGTLCTSEIAVEKRRPLSMVLPFLKHSLGI